MATKRQTLQQLQPNLEESIGVRPIRTKPRLSPTHSAKDVGRRPDRNFGRIEVSQVIPDPAQPRAEFDQDAIERLAKSINEKGQLAPIRVRWSTDHEKWIIVCGERRYRAVTAAGLPTVDCYFDEQPLSDGQILEQQMIENLLREDLSPMEKARGFKSLMDLNGWNQKQVAESLHLTPSTVTRSLALLELPEAIQEQVDNGKIAARSAYEISKVPDRQAQKNLATKVSKGMSLSDTEQAARKSKPSARKGKRLEFKAENGWTIRAVPPEKECRTYADLRVAVDEALEEIDLRINNNVRVD